MVLPNLLHPVPILLQRLDRGATVYDHDARTPVQTSRRLADVSVPGQVKWFSIEELQAAAGGATEQAKGYVVFRYIDLTARAASVAMGDRIQFTGNAAQEVYVTRLEPFAHYPDQGGPSMVKAWFTDRKPAKER